MVKDCETPLSAEKIADLIMDDANEYGYIIHDYVYTIIKNDSNRKNSWDAWFRGASGEWIALYDNNLYDPKDDKWRPKEEWEQTEENKNIGESKKMEKSQEETTKPQTELDKAYELLSEYSADICNQDSDFKENCSLTREDFMCLVGNLLFANTGLNCPSDVMDVARELPKTMKHVYYYATVNHDMTAEFLSEFLFHTLLQLEDSYEDQVDAYDQEPPIPRTVILEAFQLYARKVAHKKYSEKTLRNLFSEAEKVNLPNIDKIESKAELIESLVNFSNKRSDK